MNLRLLWASKSPKLERKIKQVRWLWGFWLSVLILLGKSCGLVVSLVFPLNPQTCGPLMSLEARMGCQSSAEYPNPTRKTPGFSRAAIGAAACAKPRPRVARIFHNYVLALKTAFNSVPRCRSGVYSVLPETYPPTYSKCMNPVIYETTPSRFLTQQQQQQRRYSVSTVSVCFLR